MARENLVGMLAQKRRGVLGLTWHRGELRQCAGLHDAAPLRMMQFGEQIVGLDLRIVEEIGGAMRAERRDARSVQRRQRLGTVHARECRGDDLRERTILRRARGLRKRHVGGELACAPQPFPVCWLRGMDE